MSFALVPRPDVFWPYAAGIAVLAIGLFTIRDEVSHARGLDKLTACARVFYATPLAIFGAEHLTDPDSIKLLVPMWMPLRTFWVYFVGVALIVAGLSLAAKVQVYLAALLMGLMFLVFEASIHIPGIAAHPRDRLAWAIALRDISFAGGAWAIAGAQTLEWLTNGRHGLITVARFLIAVPVVVFGIEHFLHPELAPAVPLRKLTPQWIPARLWLAYLVGVVLLAAGTSILLGRNQRAAATWLALVILLVVVLIYVPIMATVPSDIRTGLNYVADTLLFGGAVLALANALPKRAHIDLKVTARGTM